jgi:hypothetical protein
MKLDVTVEVSDLEKFAQDNFKLFVKQFGIQKGAVVNFPYGKAVVTILNDGRDEDPAHSFCFR